MSLTRYWDGSGWAYGESVFDGKALPPNPDEERFWRQREAVLGTRKRAVGEEAGESPYRAWRPARKSNVECLSGCGRRLWISEVRKGLKRCKVCRAAGRRERPRRATKATEAA